MSDNSYDGITLSGQIDTGRNLCDRLAEIIEVLGDRADACGELDLRDDIKAFEWDQLADFRALLDRCEEVVTIPEDD